MPKDWAGPPDLNIRLRYDIYWVYLLSIDHSFLQVFCLYTYTNIYKTL